MSDSSRAALVWGAVNLALAVAIGAFGAHGLRGSITEAALETFKTGQQYHAFAALGLMAAGASGRAPRWLIPVILVGVICFSFSLYGLAVGGPRWLGAVAPIGGAAWIGGWIGFAVSAGRASAPQNEP